MAGSPFVEKGRPGGGDHQFDCGCVKFGRTFQHLNESGSCLKNKNHSIFYVKKDCYLKKGCFLNIHVSISPGYGSVLDLVYSVCLMHFA